MFHTMLSTPKQVYISHKVITPEANVRFICANSVFWEMYRCLVYIMWCWPFENTGCHNENSEVMMFVMMALVFELERALGRS